MSIILSVERPSPRQKMVEDLNSLTASQKKEYAKQKRLEEVGRLAALQEKGAIRKGLDPGRVNLHTTAFLNGNYKRTRLRPRPRPRPRPRRRIHIQTHKWWTSMAPRSGGISRAVGFCR